MIPQVIAAIKARGLIPVLRTQRPDTEARDKSGQWSVVNGQDAIIDQNSKLKNPDSLTTDHWPLTTSHVFVLNTMGELRKLYALAFAVFAGRSFFKKGGGGSDMIEIAALAKPCCFGPFTQNFAEVVELLLSNHAAARVDSADSLAQTLAHWLENPAAAADVGRRAQDLIRAQQGSTDEYVRRLLALLNRPAPTK